MKQKRRTLSLSDKEEIGLCCCNCGSTKDLQYHHIIPISIGGQDINSNMCCLCYDCHYKLHHDGKQPKIKSYGELIKAGIKKANAKGIKNGRPSNEITVIMSNGIVHKGGTMKIAQIFNRDQRTIELWVHGKISEKTKKKLGIEDVFISKLHHNQTSLNLIINKKNRNVSNQLAFF